LRSSPWDCTPQEGEKSPPRRVEHIRMKRGAFEASDAASSRLRLVRGRRHRPFRLLFDQFERPETNGTTPQQVCKRSLQVYIDGEGISLIEVGIRAHERKTKNKLAIGIAGETAREFRVMEIPERIRQKLRLLGCNSAGSLSPINDDAFLLCGDIAVEQDRIAIPDGDRHV